MRQGTHDVLLALLFVAMAIETVNTTTTLSLFAALFGVFYTGVVVSVFVGLAQCGKRRPRDDKRRRPAVGLGG